jgi:LPXTG-motif cell wall-anchored protein
MNARKFSAIRRGRKLVSITVLAALAAASLATITFSTPNSELPAARADAPSSQPAPVSVWDEDFENNLSPSQTSVIQSYTGAQTSYTADAAWESNCDGVIISGALATISSNAGIPANNNGCDAISNWYIFWNELTSMARALQNWRTSVTNNTPFDATTPNSNHMVSAYTLTTNGVGTLPTPNRVMVKTASSLPVSAGRFYSLSLDTLFESCNLAQPSIDFYLGSTLLNSSPLNPCATGTQITYPSPNNLSQNAGSTRDAYVQRLVSDPIILSNSGSYTLEADNLQTSSNGNDGGFDNFQLLDVTPSLGVAYQYASTPLNSVETLTYTVENTTDDYAKPGFSFHQTLPTGVVRSGSTVGGTCTNTANTAATTASVNGTTSLDIAGSLPAGASCTIVINVTSSGTAAVGTQYTSSTPNFSNLVGVKADTNLASSTKFTTVTAADDTATVNEGSSVAIDVKANDTPGASSPTNPTAALAANPSVSSSSSLHGGSVTVNSGEVDYTPPANFSGNDSFSYQICDQTPTTPNCATANVTVGVNAVFTNGVAASGITTPQNTPVVSDLTQIVSTNGSALDPTKVTLASPAPAHGSIAIDPGTGAVTYTPTTGYTGSDSYSVQVCDTSSPTAQCHTVTIPVTVGANAVTAVDDSAVVTAGQSVTTPVKANDTVSVPGTPLAALPTVTSPPANGSTQVQMNGTITYTPAAGFSGIDSYGYQICDTSTPTPVCDTANVTVTVNNGFVTPGGPGTSGSPDGPNGTGAASEATPQNTPLTLPLASLLAVTGSPINPATITEVGTAPHGGTISINPSTGAVTYVPSPGYTGPDSFVLHACDTASPSQCYTEDVAMTVGSNTVVATDDNVNAVSGTPLVIDEMSNDTSGNGQALNPSSVTIVGQPSNGTVTVSTQPSSLGKITYTAANGFVGTDSFRYQVCDTSHPTPACATATVHVTVAANLLTLAFTGGVFSATWLVIAGGALLAGIILLLLRRRRRDPRHLA